MQIKAKTPAEYLAKLEPSKREEIARLHKLITQTAPALKADVNSGMLAYGPFRYKYASGREGEWFLIGLAAQKNYISLYICAVDPTTNAYLAESYRSKLPKANIGKSCIRFKRLADVDLAVIKEIILKAEQLGGAAAAV